MNNPETIETIDCTGLIKILLLNGWTAFQDALALQDHRIQVIFEKDTYFENVKDSADEPVFTLANGQSAHIGQLLEQANEDAILTLHTQLDDSTRLALWGKVHKLWSLVFSQNHTNFLAGERLKLKLLTSAQRHNIGLLFLLCCPSEEFRQYFLDGLELSKFAPYLAALRPDIIAQMQKVIRNQESLFMLPIAPLWIQALVEAKKIEQPCSEFYLLALLASTPTASQLRESPSTLALLPKLFELEGTQDISFASCDKYCKGTPWATTLLQLVEEGLIARDDLLDWSLEALANDWIQFRSGWFSRLHDALKPTFNELNTRSNRYLALCHSRIGPTVSMALAALKILQKGNALSGDSLLLALGVVLAGSHKGQISSAAKLLDLQLRNEPDMKRDCVRTLLPALAFDDASLQGQILKLLQAWGLGDEDRVQLATYQPYVASSQKTLLSQLLGQSQTDQVTKPMLDQALPILSTMQTDPLHSNLRIPEIKDCDLLIVSLSQLFENPNDCNLLEQVLAALVQLAPFTDVKPFSMVIKRAKQLIKQSPNRNVAYFVLEVLGAAPSNFTYWTSDECSSEGLLRERLIELSAWAGQGLPALDCATHQGGYIDPAILLQRWELCVKAQRLPSLTSQVRALMRLPIQRNSKICSLAANLPDSDFLHAFRYALGEEIEPSPHGQALFLAAARIRSSKKDDPATIKAYGEIGPDGSIAANYRWQTIQRQYESGGKVHHFSVLQLKSAVDSQNTLPEMPVLRRGHEINPKVHYWGEYSISQIRYLASLLPSDYSLPLAQGLLGIANNLNWDEANWQHRAYLDLLLDSQFHFDSLSLNLLILALGGKEPGQTALARDVALNAWLEGRLSAEDLGVVLSQWLPDSLVKPARYCKCLKELSRMHTLAPQLVFQVLCHALQLPSSIAPKDLSGLLELLLELKLELQQNLPEELNTVLQALNLKGKSLLILRDLLPRSSN
jgi:hypothetical protein